MTLSTWTAYLCDELSQQIAQRVTPQPAADGCLRVDLGTYGLLVMDEDSAEASLWSQTRKDAPVAPCGWA